MMGTLTLHGRAEWGWCGPHLAAAGAELADALPYLPDDAVLFLVTDDATGAIIGAWAAATYTHVHGVFIAPTHRKRAGVASKLLRLLRTWCTGARVRNVLTSADSEAVVALAQRLGGRELPGRHFVIPMEDAD